MAGIFSVDTRRVLVDMPLVDKMERLVNNNILVNFLWREVVDNAGLQRGTPNVVIGTASYPMHPAVVREFRDWMRDMQDGLLGQLIMYGLFLVRFEKVEVPGASK